MVYKACWVMFGVVNDSPESIRRLGHSNNRTIKQLYVAMLYVCRNSYVCMYAGSRIADWYNLHEVKHVRGSHGVLSTYCYSCTALCYSYSLQLYWYHRMMRHKKSQVEFIARRLR